jgi:hypothetical protein
MQTQYKMGLFKQALDRVEQLLDDVDLKHSIVEEQI